MTLRPLCPTLMGALLALAAGPALAAAVVAPAAPPADAAPFQFSPEGRVLLRGVDADPASGGTTTPVAGAKPPARPAPPLLAVAAGQLRPGAPLEVSIGPDAFVSSPILMPPQATEMTLIIRGQDSRDVPPRVQVSAQEKAVNGSGVLETRLLAPTAITNRSFRRVTAPVPKALRGATIQLKIEVPNFVPDFFGRYAFVKAIEFR